jgi:BolA protein
MSVTEQIKSRLEAALAPEHLEVRNDSHRHAGHAGDDGSGESHFHVTLKAAALVGKSRVAQHRAVHEALGKDLLARIHALGLTIER